jgi:effector-binding domain-containing protein
VFKDLNADEHRSEPDKRRFSVKLKRKSKCCLPWLVEITGNRKEYEMQITISETPWVKTLFGLAKTHDPSHTYGEEIVALLGPVWEAVHKNQVATTGINHAVYGENGEYFCGLECTGQTQPIPGLIQRRITLDRYAYSKLTGPYSEIPRVYDEINAEIKRLGRRAIAPAVEIYGHWNDDPGKLETEILIHVSE